MAFTRIGLPSHAGISGVTSDQHHADAHTPESHTGQGATAAELETLTDASDADALHSHPIHPIEATQAQVEARTAGVLFPPLDLMQHHPGVAKLFLFILATGVNDTPVYNVDATTDTAVGNRTVNFTTDFSTAVHNILANLQDNNDTDQIQLDTRAVGSIRLRTSDGASSLVDRGTSVVGFGDQA